MPRTLAASLAAPAASRRRRAAMCDAAPEMLDAAPEMLDAAPEMLDAAPEMPGELCRVWDGMNWMGSGPSREVSGA